MILGKTEIRGRLVQWVRLDLREIRGQRATPARKVLRELAQEILAPWVRPARLARTARRDRKVILAPPERTARKVQLVLRAPMVLRVRPVQLARRGPRVSKGLQGTQERPARRGLPEPRGTRVQRVRRAFRAILDRKAFRDLKATLARKVRPVPMARKGLPALPALPARRGQSV